MRLDGQAQSNLDFGYGILGRLHKGGWFRLERVQVNATDWKTQRLEVHLIGRALLFKTIARATSEVRSGFSAVPACLSIEQGVDLLRTQDLAAMPHGKSQRMYGSSRLSPGRASSKTRHMPMRNAEDRFARDIGMGVSPITSICAVSLLNHGKEESCVPPPFAVDPCEPAGDDTYDSGGSQLDRGREGEQEQLAPELEGSAEEEGSQAVDPDASVNLFA